MQNKANKWSEGLQQRTREAVDEMEIGADGKLHFKCSGGGYGFMTAEDMLDGKLIVADKETNQLSEFADVDELLNAGWAID